MGEASPPLPPPPVSFICRETDNPRCKYSVYTMESPARCAVVVQQPTSHPPATPYKPVIRDTACGTQTRFRVKGPEAAITLKRWRTALHTRYFWLLESSGFHSLIWRDTDHKNNDLAVDDSLLDCSTSALPDDLGRTFVQVIEGSAKKITITLHYHKRRISGGCCHVQGHEKDFWVLSEYEALCAFVQQLQEGSTNPSDIPKWQPGVDCPSPIVTYPVTVPPSSRGLLLEVSADDTPGTPVRSLMGLHHEDSTISLVVQSTDPVSPTPCQALQPQRLRPDFAAGLSVSAHSAPLAAITVDTTDTATLHPPAQSPVRHLTTPSPSLKTPFPPASPHSVLLYAAPNEVSHVIEVSEDAEVSLAATPHCTATVKQLADSIPVLCTDEDVTSELVVSGTSSAVPTFAMRLQAQLDSAHDIIKSLRQEIYSLKADVTTAMSRVNQLDCEVRDNAVKATNATKMSEACIGDKIAGLHDQLITLSSAQHMIQDNVSRLVDARDSHGHLIRDLAKRITNRDTPPSDQPPQQPPTTCSESAAPPGNTGSANPPLHTIGPENQRAAGKSIPVRVTLAKDISKEDLTSSRKRTVAR
ncbi:hypothetical protein BaRGS_00034281 [Batillaria attramentaria]|uniref:Uncharacterized protein n=1 Tax=Batillaria attramentaria TaxID=370345 RepID=A0ABD0JHS3_9CAEN